MKKKLNYLFVLLILMVSVTACGKQNEEQADKDVIVLRISNWEEYIDEGDWDEEELIELENGDTIFGENSMIEDFENWYYEEYGLKVKVEYSTFGTNEDLYNQLSIGDVYDLVCPSDYLIMKLMDEKKLVPFSDEFLSNKEDNYYYNGVSPYIRSVFDNYSINDEAWSKYAACYMWGTSGIIYNPEYVTEEEASTWDIFVNDKFKRQITVKDNVRDSMFAAMGIYKKQLLMEPAFINSPDYAGRLFTEFNDTSDKTIDGVEKVLKDMKNVAYAFETDAGKADIVSGKVVANYQWSGDAVYAMDQAEEDDVYLNYAVPKEGTNLWFDGWVMLKDGISEDIRKQHACEAFINFVSRPDNAVRNMYYIGYTSSIAGTDDTVSQYINYNYSAEEDAEEVTDYDISYFFGKEVVISADKEQLSRQLFAQYPPKEVMDRSSVMWFFDKDTSSKINKMWINVRCFEVKDAAKPLAFFALAIIIIIILAVIYLQRHKVFNIKKKNNQTY